MLYPETVCLKQFTWELYQKRRAKVHGGNLSGVDRQGRGEDGETLLANSVSRTMTFSNTSRAGQGALDGQSFRPFAAPMPAAEISGTRAGPKNRTFPYYRNGKVRKFS